MKKLFNSRFGAALTLCFLLLLTACSSIPTGSIPTDSIPAGSVPADSLPAGSENIPSNPLDESQAEYSTYADDSYNSTSAIPMEEIPTDSLLEVHFLDIGQGDSTLVICDGHAMLIDTGDDSKGTAIQNYLTKQGVEHLDYLILTHPDADHIGSAPVIISKFDIDTVFMSNFEKDNKTYRKLIQALDDKRLSHSTPAVGSTYTLGTATFTIVAPNASYNSPNDASVALLLSHGSSTFLFTGDAEETAESDILKNGIALQADVYHVGHHGSKSSSSEALLDAVVPSYAIISCEEGNSYGHPHAQTLNNLRSRDIQVFRTDEQGTIIASSTGAGLSWNAAPSTTWQVGEGSASQTTQPVGGGSASQTTQPVGEGSAPQTTQPVGGGSTSQTTQPVGEGSASQTTQPVGGGSASQTTQPVGEGSASQTTQPSPEEETATSQNEESEAITYILNTKTMKFHFSRCSFLPTANRSDSTLSRDTIIEQGYEPCKKCNP